MPRNVAPMVLACILLQAAFAAQNVSTAPTPAQLPRAYEKWLNQDVLYIVTGEERSAFERLRTDEERDRFIEQFWLRRNPNPGGSENPFKEEHYRRIAYSNAHFSFGHVSGWRTDRGRIYITMGPPDRIERHFDDAPAFERRHHERWHYRRAGTDPDSTIDFVDEKGIGDFRISGSSRP